MNNVKKFLQMRLFYFLSFLLVFIACQKDDDGSPLLFEAHQHEQIQTTTTTVSLDEIPKVAEYLSTLGDQRGHFTIEKSIYSNYRLNEPDLVIGTLQTREIIEVTDQYDQKNHTFLLSSIGSANTTVKSTFNLIVQESLSGLFSYIVEYRPDENWIPNYRDLQDFSTYSGEIIHYSITGRYIAKLNLIDGVAINGETRSPCSDDGDPNGDTGNNGGNDGNPGPGDSGPGDGDGGGNEDNPPPDPDVSADLKWLCVWRQFLHNEPSECNNPSLGGSWVIVITYGDKSVEDTVRCPNDLPELPEVCYDNNGDPCPNQCDPNGNGCAEAPIDPNPVVAVNYDLALIYSLNQFLEPNLTTEQIDWIFENEENVAFAVELNNFLEALDGSEYEDYYEDYLISAIDDIKEDGVLDVEFSYPKPHCSSFEYASGMNGALKGSAVVGIHNFFMSLKADSDGIKFHYIDLDLPVMYFNVPGVILNGVAATESAIALDQAIDATENWFSINFEANGFVVTEQWINNINFEMSLLLGGSVSRIPSFPIPNPAPYVIDLFTTGNCM
ncbi:hypothetical protein ACFO3O_06190 [Dokdonia ponticola]|uniref:Uncharacterized protein n=1 Tax=Dokdonia ponticola TaxID=2041041 RepID=A0ABV9HTM4_9FLAO